ncbi:MAG TPA: anti-sigma factor [Pseudobacteroides sp.]|uniref:anti-sigma factor n=1 Tax=Pseudobacteroides sp. TaxID=1968840 RepID=UPI002F92F037
MKKCEDIRELISLYIDGELKGDLLSEFEEHIRSCETCRNELEDVNSVIAMLNDTPEEDLPSNFKDELHEKLLREQTKKESFVSVVLSRYSHVFASAAGLLIIFSIWVVYKNSFVSTNDTVPNVSSIQSYDSNGNEAKENGEIEKFNLADGDKRVYSRFSKELTQDNTKENSTGGTQDQKIIAGMADAPVITFSEKSSNPKYDPADKQTASVGNGELAFGKKYGDIATPKARASSEPKSDVIAVLFDDSRSSAADFTISASDPEAKSETLKKIAASLGGEEHVLVNASTSMNTDDLKAISSKASEASSDVFTAESNNTVAVLNFRIPGNNYSTFLQKLNETFGASNVKSNGVINTDNTKRKAEIEKEIAEIDKQIQSNANTTFWNNSAEHNTLVENKNGLNRELEEINKNSQYVTVTIRLQKR